MSAKVLDFAEAKARRAARRADGSLPQSFVQPQGPLSRTEASLSALIPFPTERIAAAKRGPASVSRAKRHAETPLEEALDALNSCSASALFHERLRAFQTAYQEGMRRWREPEPTEG